MRVFVHTIYIITYNYICMDLNPSPLSWSTIRFGPPDIIDSAASNQKTGYWYNVICGGICGEVWHCFLDAAGNMPALATLIKHGTLKQEPTGTISVSDENSRPRNLGCFTFSKEHSISVPSRPPY